jgi:membrane-bound metal-dependent hydrolase YbcI (DUF457 family)
MAPNPLHALVLLPLYFRRPGAFDPAALVVSSVAVDLEVICAYLAGYPSPHMAQHSFLVALTVYPLAVALFTYLLERRMAKRLVKFYKKLRWDERVIYPFRTILLSSMLGGFSHLLIDVWTHPVSPFIFWPFIYLPNNPLYLGAWSAVVDVIVVLVGAYALYIWAMRWKRMPDPP